MESRKLGSLTVSKQGLGCMSLSSNIYKNSASNEDAVRLVRRAIELGVTHFDTAIVYGPFTSEQILGEAVKGTARKGVVLATKTGIDVRPTATRPLNSSPEYIRESCLGCLERLQTDYIDLFYLHRIDSTVPIEESMAELKKLRDEGKIRHIGLSEASASTIRRAHAVAPVSAVQVEWSLWSRDAEEEVIPTCRELGIGIVAYSPLGRGFLTGQIKSKKDLPEGSLQSLGSSVSMLCGWSGDWRLSNPRFTDEALEKNAKFVEKIEQMAAAKHCSVGQLSLAWVLAQGQDVCPIPGTSKIAHMEDNLKANEISLSAEELQLLNQSVPVSEVQGDRYEPGNPTFKDN